MIDSNQWMTIHPVAEPDSIPMHQGVLPSASMRFESAMRSSHVTGTGYQAASNSSAA